MRFVNCIIKTMIENLRDWKILMFSLGFAPCFVLILFMMYGSGSQSYKVALINSDKGFLGQEVISQIKQATFEGGGLKYHLEILKASDLKPSLERLKNRSLDAVGVIQPDFSNTLKMAADRKPYESTQFKLYGDPQNMRYSVASIYLLTDLDQYVVEQTHYKQPVVLDETLVGRGKSLSDFDMYVPGIVVFALLNVLFTAGAALIREVEKGTMTRLILSRLSTGEFIGAIGLMQTLLCLVSMFLALWMAKLCGFDMKGSLSTLLVLGLLSSVGVLGLALLTVSLLKTVYDLMTVGVVPYFMVMFFGGIFFPLPPVSLFELGDRAVLVNDLLPLSLSVSAFNRVMNFGAGLGDLKYELAGITLIAGVYVVAGLMLFRHKHMRLG